ncbi:MAG TPA: hypothetical protein VKA15_16370 [Isosphaeraceae bacterium]|nr:hypothetical protein [Isosphaeraceae bacterium]
MTRIEGSVLLVCRHCTAASIEGSNIWLPMGDPDVWDALDILAGRVEESKSKDREMLESDISDPRWSKRDLLAGESLKIDP